MKNRRYWTTYIRDLADRMNLLEWDLELSGETCPDSDLANIDSTYGQCHAVVYLCAGWDGMAAKTQRDTIVHELLHLHLAQCRHLTDDLLEQAGAQAQRYGSAAWNLTEEYAVEKMAQAWAPLLPMPRGKK